jgi:hypothetical protein
MADDLFYLEIRMFFGSIIVEDGLQLRYEVIVLFGDL